MPDAAIVIHPELSPGIVSQDGLSVRQDTLFTDHKGKESGKIRKEAEKHLKNLAGPLTKILQPGETILYVASGLSPASLFEQWSFGWYIMVVSKCVLVFTNQRVLHLPVTQKGKWQEQIRSARWGDLKKTKVSGWLGTRVWNVEYRSGKKEKFSNIAGRDGKKLQKILEAIAPENLSEVSPAQEMVSLCPDSMTPIAPGAEQCPECTTRFKKAGEMVRYSLLIPGGGYFYTGHPVMGAFDFITEAVLLYFTLLFALIALGMPNPFEGPLDATVTPAAAWAIAGILGFLLGLEKLMTIHHGKFFLRYFLPERKEGSTHAYTVASALSGLALVALLALSYSNPGPPLKVVAADLTVTKSYFGLFGVHTVNQQTELRFEESDTVPGVEGVEFGWILRLDTARDKVTWREEFDIPAVYEAGSAGPDAVPIAEAWTATMEGEQETDGGFVVSRWSIGEGDPEGTYTLRVFMDDELVQTFTYRVVHHSVPYD